MHTSIDNMLYPLDEITVGEKSGAKEPKFDHEYVLVGTNASEEHIYDEYGPVGHYAEQGPTNEVLLFILYGLI